MLSHINVTYKHDPLGDRCLYHWLAKKENVSIWLTLYKIIRPITCILLIEFKQELDISIQQVKCTDPTCLI